MQETPFILKQKTRYPTTTNLEKKLSMFYGAYQDVWS